MTASIERRRRRRWLRDQTRSLHSFGGFADEATAAEFEILDTWARGPVVVNDRIDRFVLPQRTLEIPVVGVFHLVEGKIVEWSDFVFDFGPQG